MRGKSDRDVLVSLILEACKYGERIPAGVRVSIGVRDLALIARVSMTTMQKSIQRLKEAGWVRRDDYNRSPGMAGAFVLLEDRAKVTHSTSGEGEGIEPHSKGVCKDCAPPYSLERLRWTALDYEGGKRVGTIHRLGKTCGAAIDHLEAAAGTLTLRELADALGVSRDRVRDLFRRSKHRYGVVAKLEDAAVVECSGDTVSLAADWRDALAAECERAGEIDADRRDMARYARESEAYRQHLKEPRKPATVEYEGIIADRETGEVLEDRAAGASRRERPAEDGSDPGDSWPFPNPAHDAAPESSDGTIRFLSELISVRTETPPPEGDPDAHPPDCECPECSVLANRHAKSAA